MQYRQCILPAVPAPNTLSLAISPVMVVRPGEGGQERAVYAQRRRDNAQPRNHGGFLDRLYRLADHGVRRESRTASASGQYECTADSASGTPRTASASDSTLEQQLHASSPIADAIRGPSHSSSSSSRQHEQWLHGGKVLVAGQQDVQQCLQGGPPP